MSGRYFYIEMWQHNNGKQRLQISWENLGPEKRIGCFFIHPVNILERKKGFLKNLLLTDQS